MKKTARRILSVAICFIMVVQTMMIGGFSFTSSAATGVLYQTDFSSDFNSLKNTGLWDVETDQRRDATAPDMNNAMVMNSRDSVQFKWLDVDGVGSYSSANTYVFEFDVKVTNAGSGALYTGPDHTRVVYVAFGGWFNQVQINDKNNKLVVGDTKTDYSDTTFMNKTVHVKVSLTGNTVTSVVTDASGNQISKGSRTNVEYTNMSYVAPKYYSDDNRTLAPTMTYLVVRCEDGGFEMDNFKFSVKEAASAPVKASSMTLSSPQNKQAVYECKLNYTEDSVNYVMLGNKEIFNLSEGTLKICEAEVLGTYKPGQYGIKVIVNNQQKAMYVELTLPDGGTLRRGTSAMLGGTSIDVYSPSVANVSDVKISYESISENSYELVQSEPMASGFGQYLYNISTSFNDATSTRNFAWTTNEYYLGGDSFALKYRVKGTTAWTVVDALKRAEKTNVPTEDYYEADIKGLKADTEYEYKIGIKTSTDEQNDWTQTYTFKTAKEDITDFSFVAIGDTQSLAWGGDTSSNKGYKYAMVALEEAMQEVPDAAFILNTGDVTDQGDNLQYWNWYFKSLGKYGATVPHFATQGNHDAWGSGNNNFFSLHFNHPNNGDNALDMSIANNVTSANGKRLVSHYKDTIYSYNYGDVHFIVLNSGPYSSDDIHILKAQRTWLEEDLKANADARWTILMVHEAVYHRVGGNESRPWLYDTIEKYGVDLVIQGHSHLVTRTYPMKDGKIVTKTSPDLIQQGTGTVYTTIGSTTITHDVLGNPNVEECMTVYTPESLQPTYTVVSVKEDKLVMTVKQINGYVVDEFTIAADPNYVPPEKDENDNENEGELPGDNGNDNNENDNENNNENNNENTQKPEGGNTQKPENDNTQKPGATDDTEEESSGGCGGVVGGAVAVIAAVAAAGIGISFRKREE